MVVHDIIEIESDNEIECLSFKCPKEDSFDLQRKSSSSTAKARDSNKVLENKTNAKWDTPLRRIVDLAESKSNVFWSEMGHLFEDAFAKSPKSRSDSSFPTSRFHVNEQKDQSSPISEEEKPSRVEDGQVTPKSTSSQDGTPIIYSNSINTPCVIGSPLLSKARVCFNKNPELSRDIEEYSFPDLHALFVSYDSDYFGSTLRSVEVKWSQRLTLCAGLCIYRNGGFCLIRLSEPLLKYRSIKDFRETLLHEMIHAYLFVTKNNRDRTGHGPEFQQLMHRLNAMTVYHTFYDEVNHYRRHIWNCDGPCKNRGPFYGILRRATNRAPGPSDFWWEVHQRTCGGKYHKVSSPLDSNQSKCKKSKRTYKEAFIQQASSFDSKKTTKVNGGETKTGK